MKYFLDTNIIIYSLKDSFPAVKTHFLKIPSQSIVIPAVVMAEIEYGAMKSYNYEKTIKQYKMFTDVFEKVSFSEEACYYYGKIRSDLEKQGKIIGANDMLIASIVLAEKGILVTHNIGEFQRIKELQIEDWTI
ncbi:MAG: type II toxin-antitoxin system VapC family toxin [Lachnospiraceae bacterium]|nr:type II toxin-antitoxin system VapC family toxin [Lachnospiraceae bacterium]